MRHRLPDRQFTSINCHSFGCRCLQYFQFGLLPGSESAPKWLSKRSDLHRVTTPNFGCQSITNEHCRGLAKSSNTVLFPGEGGTLNTKIHGHGSSCRRHPLRHDHDKLVLRRKIFVCRSSSSPRSQQMPSRIRSAPLAEKILDTTAHRFQKQPRLGRNRCRARDQFQGGFMRRSWLAKTKNRSGSRARSRKTTSGPDAGRGLS